MSAPRERLGSPRRGAFAATRPTPAGGSPPRNYSCRHALESFPNVLEGDARRAPRDLVRASACARVRGRRV